MLKIASINHSGSEMSANFEATRLRSAYVLADRPVAAGTETWLINLKDNYLNQASPAVKRHVCNKFCEKLDPPVMTQHVEEMYSCLKIFRATEEAKQNEDKVLPVIYVNIHNRLQEVFGDTNEKKSLML